MAYNAWAAAGHYPGSLLSPHTEKTTVTANRFGDKVETKTVADASGEVATTRMVGHGGEVQETSVRDRITGVTHHSRTRSGSPRGYYGGYRGNSVYGGYRGYYGGSAGSLSGRPADLVATDPLWRAAHIDGGEYRAGALLDAPLHGRSAYLDDSLLSRRGAYLDAPSFARHGAYLDDPLYRRGAHLDDPLYRRGAYLDDPLYRRGAHLDDPLYRRGAYLDDPLYRGGRYLDDPLYRRGGHFDDPLDRHGAYLNDALYRRGGLFNGHEPSNWRIADPYTVGSGRPLQMEDAALIRSTGCLDIDPRLASPRRRAEELRSMPFFL